jgi:WD repeat-containing protein 7
LNIFADAESHILFFDIEGLIVELHSEEYAAMSPTTLEVKFTCIAGFM